VNTRAPSRRYDSVHQDWRAFLPEGKADFFSNHQQALNGFYFTFSYLLNEALNFRQLGDSSLASQELTLAAESCARLAQQVSAVLHSMRQYSRHFGIIPNLAPLQTSDFHSENGQRRARHNNLFSRIMLTERSQFLYKLNTLEEIVDEQTAEIAASARSLAGGSSIKALDLWQSLDICHFDITTCLCETDVCLKSFLFVLPEQHLHRFESRIKRLSRGRRNPGVAAIAAIRARRMLASAGE